MGDFLQSTNHSISSKAVLVPELVDPAQEEDTAQTEEERLELQLAEKAHGPEWLKLYKDAHTKPSSEYQEKCLDSETLRSFVRRPSIF